MIEADSGYQYPEPEYSEIQRGESRVHIASLAGSGGLDELRMFIDALIRAAKIDSENAAHPLRMEESLKDSPLTGLDDVLERFAATRPRLRAAARRRGRVVPSYRPSAFIPERDEQESDRAVITWECYRVPVSQSDEEEIPEARKFGTIVTLEINGSAYRLAVESPRAHSAKRCILAAVGKSVRPSWAEHRGISHIVQAPSAPEWTEVPWKRP